MNLYLFQKFNMRFGFISQRFASPFLGFEFKIPTKISVFNMDFELKTPPYPGMFGNCEAKVLVPTKTQALGMQQLIPSSPMCHVRKEQ